MPLFLVSCGLQYLDKTALAYAAMLGMNKELVCRGSAFSYTENTPLNVAERQHLVGQEYSWSNSIYEVGFLVASYPVSVGFVKFPLGKYISTFMYSPLNNARIETPR
jgi:hypothetical protein